MQVDNIALKHFRNHNKSEYKFNPKITLITGTNGSGKTSILEAIYLLATGKSPKATYDVDLIQHDKTYASIKGEIENEEDSYSIEINILRNDDESHLSSKKIKVNKSPKAVAYLATVFNCVMFSPEDIQLLTGSPANRRRYMDLLLSQAFKRYRKNLSNYVKAVRQRNKVLEMMNEMHQGYDQIEFWDDKILKFGVEIAQDRADFTTFVKTSVDSMSDKLNHDKNTWEFMHKVNEISQERIDKYKDKEIAAKTTLIGPHRDDFSVLLNNKNAAEFASRGQQRTIVLALKLIEISFLEKIRQERPILLLDDIFSELDEIHRNAVINVIDRQQTIITTAEPLDYLPKNIGSELKL